MNSIAAELLRFVNIEDKIINIKGVKDEELGKEYGVYIVDTEGEKFILKNSSSDYEGRVHVIISAKIQELLPKFIGHMEDEEGRWWILMEHLDGETLISKGRESYINMSRSLARIHRTFLNTEVEDGWIKNSSIKIIKKIDCINEIYRSGNASEIEKYKVFPEILDKLRYIGQRMLQRPHTLVHKDLLPINIMEYEEEIKIIDWEHGGLGIYTSDIGRLIGDFKSEKKEYWVNRDWEEDILKSYYNEMCKNICFDVSYQEFMGDYNLSKLMNHAVIVLAFIINRWDATPWYWANYEMMERIIKNIEGDN